MGRPFEGIKVLDATHVLAGPYCGYQLALMGAETIKVENPLEPDPVRTRGPATRLNEAGLGLNFLTQNNNKKSLTLNLKTEEGRKIFLDLAEKSDVVIENFRTGSFDAMGLGYEDIRRRNPSVIYCSITAFGRNGPEAERTGYDPVMQGVCGVMAAGATEERLPMKAGAPFIDYASGMTAAFAVASALFHRERTGQGQRIDCAMLDVSIAFMGPAATSAAYQGSKTPLPREAGTDLYKAKDGWLQLGAYNFRQNRRMWTALGYPEFAAYDSWPEIWDNAHRMRETLSHIIATKTAAEWEAFFIGLSVPAGRVRDIDETMGLDQLKARNTWSDVSGTEGFSGVHVPGAPFLFANDGPRVDSASPSLGQHNEEVLSTLGYTSNDLRTLKDRGVI